VIVFPAIDLKEGKCVRLRQGDMAQATVFNQDPGAQARSFQSAGFKWLHVVDLNGAVSGASVNTSAVREILAAVRTPVQLGGGIRDLQTIESWLSAGVARVILGTAAVRNPALASQAAKRFPEQIAVGIDARAGMVAVDGWTATSSISAIVFTDIARDGMLAGVNVSETAAIASAIAIPVIASGGVNGVDDIRRLKESGARIAGVVIGRALYDGRITAAGALAAATE
jgi:phosphoribosylformimino-5-aminoimidazole carboxamide ribotide isomerase